MSLTYPRRFIPALLLGLAPIAGLHAEQWPAPIAATEAHGVEIVGKFDAPSGLQGFAGRINNQGIALYLTEDQQHVIVGTLLDAEGEDLSRAPLEKLVYEPMSGEMWSNLEASHWIADGADNAPRIVYSFTDPNCPYCSMFWKQTRPWVDAGKVQIRHIMVGILREDSLGKSAALLAAKDPAAALRAHESDKPVKPLKEVTPALAEQLKANYQLMGQLGASATPAIFYQDENGNIKQQMGAPQPDKLKEVMGPQ